MIEFNNISKYYGDLLAVSELNLKINDGEVFGFLGPNGAGKTTSIKMTTGLLAPTTGNVLIDGIDVQAEPERAKQIIGYIPDTPYIYDKLTAWEFVSLVGGLYGMSEKDVLEKSKYYFDLLRIGAWANDRAEEYSHGMRQKVVLAASLMHEPKIIVVDEPMVGLDPQSQKTVKNILRQKAKEGCTVFMSTHTLYIAEEICDRVAIINHGKLIMLEHIKDLHKKMESNSTVLEDVFLEITEDV